jgi:hypothetical protein
MTARASAIDSGLRTPHLALLCACLALAACSTMPPPPSHWVKAGVDEATTAREFDACRQQANAVLARQQGIDQDIAATLGGTWRLSNTTQIQQQSLNGSAQGLANQALRNCMLAKGFKAG